jgi:hypothetical protein
MVKKSVRHIKSSRSRQYTKFVRDLSDLLKTRDPFGLIAAGAPKDEYDSEANAIAARLRECITVEGANKVLVEVFNRSFDRSDTQPYLQLAEEVCESALAFWHSTSENPQ